MIVEYKYAGSSAIVNGLTDGRVALATNTLREATFFHGMLKKPLLFREALAALYHVVISDYKFRPRDRVAFQTWLEEQDRKFLANLGVNSSKAREKIQSLEARLGELNQLREVRLHPYYQARTKYFQYVLDHEYEQYYLFDPVISVHPDEVSFEAFSRDESSYARLGAKHELFGNIDNLECGTTNIDFSHKLHGELDRMRTYRETQFEVSPSGFQVETQGSESYKEKKIDLPESWIMGFLQVHSTMTLGLTHFQMAPVDLFNICRFLRRHKAKKSPRAMRYELTPGKPVKVVFEPWEVTLELSPCSRFDGPKPMSIRTWGRDRLTNLARLIPACSKIDVYLAGFGMPSIYLLDLGPLQFTLALSGWTDNDWTSGASKFDLLTRRLNVTAAELATTYEHLSKVKLGNDSAISLATSLGLEKTRSALSHLCQVGRAMYDLGDRVFRHRELFLEPFTVKEAQSAVKSGVGTNPEEQAADTIFSQGDVRITARRPVQTGYKLTGSAKGKDGQRMRPLLSVDSTGHVIEGSCTCSFFKKHQLTQGPCQHILALRLAHMSRLETDDNLACTW
jgi:hypothetical protein